MLKKIILSILSFVSLGLMFAPLQAEPVPAQAVSTQIVKAQPMDQFAVLQAKRKALAAQGYRVAEGRGQSRPSVELATPSTSQEIVPTQSQEEFKLVESGSRVAYTATASNLMGEFFDKMQYVYPLFPCDWMGSFATVFTGMRYSSLCLSAVLAGWDYTKEIDVRLKLDEKTNEPLFNDGKYATEKYYTDRVFYKKFSTKRALRHVASRYLTNALYGEFVQGVDKAVAAIGYPRIRLRYPFPLSQEPLSYRKLGVFGTMKTTVIDAFKIFGEECFNKCIVNPIRGVLEWAITDNVMNTVFGEKK